MVCITCLESPDSRRLMRGGGRRSHEESGPAAPLVGLRAFALGASLYRLGLSGAHRAAHRSPLPVGLREHLREDASGRLGKSS